MPLVIADRVRETTLTSGTGTLTLAGPYSGFQAFSVIGNGNTTYYAIIDAQNGAWEVGIGAYTSSGNTLSRATVLASSNAGSLVNFGTGTKDVILTQPARRSVLVQEGGSGLLTGVAAFTANGVPYADSTSTLATSANMTFNGTRLTVADLADSGLTSGRVTYASTGGALVDSANLTFDGTNLTLGGGTANGVAYLNGSKVLTTGSALTFDAGASGELALTRASSAFFKTTETGGTVTSYFGSFSGLNYIGTTTNHPVAFYVNSAEQMRLTSTGLGIGTSSPGSKLAVTGAAGTGSIAVLTNSTATSTTTFANPILKLISGASGADSSIQFTDNITANGYVSWKNSTLNFSTNSGINHMMLDSSGNLGIGTSSPSCKLDVVGADNNQLQYRTSTRTIGIGSIGGVASLFAGSGTELAFNIGGERMRLDSSGNLGLGVTPSAWNADYKAIDVSTYATLYGRVTTPTSGFSSNSFRNAGGSWIYKTTSGASRYEQDSGFHIWFNAPSGTAGNAISFTQAMTLDASGNLGVGTTSIASGGAGTVNVNFHTPSSTSVYLKLSNAGTGNTASDGFDLIADASGNAYLFNRENASMLFGTNNTERARIDSSGRFLIGTTSATASGGLLQIGQVPNSSSSSIGFNNNDNAVISSRYSMVFQNDSDNNIGGRSFEWKKGGKGYGDGSNLMTLDSSGNLLVGATASTYHTFLKNTNNDWCTAVINTASSTPQGLLIRYTGASPNNTGSTFLLGLDSGNTTRFAFYSNGGLANYQGNNVNLSDRREKTNFAPAKSYLETICAIPVQTFNYIDQNMEEDPGATLGVVAQDVQAVAPELVAESNWGTEEEPKMRLSVYQTDLQYALMKCIQEQQAIIQTLTARVAALESN